MDPSLVDFIFAERLDDGREHVYPAGEIILDFLKAGDQWKDIRGKIKARNRMKQTLHFVLAYFSTANMAFSTLCRTIRLIRVTTT